MNSLNLMLPEVVVAVLGMVLLLWGAVRGDKAAGFVTGAAAASLALAALLVWRGAPAATEVFGGSFVVDGFARFAKTLLLVASALSLALAPLFLTGKARFKPEYPVLVMLAALGLMVMVSARDLIVLYAGLEMQSLALYVLAAFEREDKRSSEAGLKYFILGSVSSAILLFGLSLVYGFAGSTSFAGIASKLAVVPMGPAAIGLAFVLAGFAFKISAAPFHMWTPDVYEGAPTPVTGFLTTAPKVAGLVLLARLLVEALAPVAASWQPLVIGMAALSMVLGSFAGLGQKNLKRLMAYSAIAHVGIMMAGLVVLADPAAGVAGLTGVLLYLALYFISAIGVFATLLCLRRDGQPVEAIEDLAGLFKTQPALTFAMGVHLFSLAGIPPLAGFFGKYFVFLAAIKGGMVALTVLGVLASVVAAAYYLRIVKVMTFDEAPEKALDIVPDRALAGVVALSVLAASLFILAPSPLMEGAKKAAESLLAP